MTVILESAPERFSDLPERESHWIEDRVTRMIKMLEESDQFAHIKFDGRPYDEQTAHFRLLQYHRDSIEMGFSNEGRQTILDLAVDFGIAAGLSDEVLQANWLTASQEDRTYNLIAR